MEIKHYKVHIGLDLPLKAVQVLLSTIASGWVGGQQENSCPNCISEIIRYNILILGRNIWSGCSCATSW